MKTLIYSSITMLFLFVAAGCGGQEEPQDMPPPDDMTQDAPGEGMAEEDPMGAAADEATFHATLSGDAITEEGAADGSGDAEVVLSPMDGSVCYEITVENIGDAQAAHIHTGAAGEDGPPVVDFDVPTNGLSGCVDADEETIRSISTSPSNYYVNIHTEEYGGGAVRGQLEAAM